MSARRRRSIRSTCLARTSSGLWIWLSLTRQPEMLRYTRTVAARAVALARRGPAGPVHINCPYREPLLPDPAAALAAPEARAEDRPYVAVSAGLRAPDAALVAALAADLSALPRGLIICGPHDDPALADALTRLAGALGYPILADPLSGLRNGDHDRALVLDCYDAFLRDAAFVERFAPQVVLRFGAMPVSKPLLLYLQRHQGCRLIVVDGDGGWNEPTLLASDMIYADARLLCEAVLRRGVAAVAGSQYRERLQPRRQMWQHKSSAWAGAWQSADRSARAAIAARFEALDELFEGRVFAELARAAARWRAAVRRQQHADPRSGHVLPWRRARDSPACQSRRERHRRRGVERAGCRRRRPWADRAGDRRSVVLPRLRTACWRRCSTT